MDYTNILENIVNAVGAEKVITGDMIGADFCHDEYPGGNFTPEAVIECASTEDISAVLKICSENAVPVTVRGAGTGQVGGSVPVNGGIVLSVKGMNKVLGFEDGILRVQPGVLLQDVKSAAEENGMYYPPDPGELTSTIGGNAATNAGGPCAVKYGKTRDYIVDAVIVKADGSIAALAGNEAAIGSEGTLAVIAELSLRLAEKPGSDAILLFPFMDSEAAVNAAKAIINAGFEPATAELMDTDIIEFSGNITGNPVFPVEMDGDRVGCTLMVTIEGADDDDVMEKMEAVAGLTEEGEIECLDILVGDTSSMKREFWAAHAAFHTSVESGAKSAVEVNVDLPMENISEMIDFAKETAEANGLKALIHAHVGSGGMHIHAVSDKSRTESADAFAAFCDAAYAKTAELGGSIVGEYGIGYAKTKYNAAYAEGFKALKAEFDPAGILNPGKIVDEAVEAVEVPAVKTAIAAEKVEETIESAETAAFEEKTDESAPAGNLNILCCVKQTPDVDQMRMDPETGLLVRAGVPAILNPQDANALAAALSVKETYGGEITLITMGPPSAEEVLRECLAVGADKAVLVTDRAFGNADTLATSYSILSAAKTQDEYDMIFCGKETIDGATGQMGAQLAERFNAAQVTSALLIKNVNEAEGTVLVDRQLDDGVETLEVKLPVLFTMEKVNYPARIPNLKGKMAAKKAEITVITSNDIPGLDRDRIGDPGSPTKVPRMFPPVMPEPGVILDEGSVEANVAKLLGLIKD